MLSSLEVDSVSLRAGEASGVSRTELWSKLSATGKSCVLALTAMFGGFDWTGLVVGCLIGLIVMKVCCFTFQRLPGSSAEVPLFGRQ